MKLMLVITDKGKTQMLMKAINQMNSLISVTFLGKGTASSEILDVLSLAQTDKDVLFAFANDNEIKYIFSKLEEELHFTKKKLGVACSISLNGITQKTLQHIQSNMTLGDK